MKWSVFVTVPKGVEPLLAEELRSFGVIEQQVTRGGINCRLDPASAYRICLWSRVASRVLLSVAEFKAGTPDELYEGIRQTAWEEHLAADGSLAIDLTLTESRLKHSHYAALKVKDAIVDQLRERHGERPSVNLEQPDVRVNVNIHKNQVRVSIDLAGQGLHRRGYRVAPVVAPLKENLAAALLLQAQWPTLAAAGLPLLDPMCGSGTLPIEAAWMALDIAPGLLRAHYGFQRWRGHDASAWEALLTEARGRRAQAADRRIALYGYDVDRTAVRAAMQNLQQAGLAGKVHFERRSLTEVEPIGQRGGLCIVNPPYGERLDGDSELPALYSDLGTVMRQRFAGWHMAVFTGNAGLVHRLRLPATARWPVNNGKIPCALLQWQLAQNPAAASAATELPSRSNSTAQVHPAVQAEMFANRLRKNWQHLSRWARRNDVYCFRVYDADLPEYALAVDYYSGAGRWVHVQEYRAPSSIDPDKAAARLQAALAVIPAVLDLPPAALYTKTRQRQKGVEQYEKLADQGEFHEVKEGDCRLLVNFTDYLDTGLFLDHRPLRNRIHELAAGKRFLNLFAYTGTATVAAATGGAAATTSVDLSKTYLDWAQRNLARNAVASGEHAFVHADCLDWLPQAANLGQRYELILLDPPTFSNSKRMDGTFDVQRDHVPLIAAAVRLLTPEGQLFFSTNRQRFQLDEKALPGLSLVDISAQTVPPDFSRHSSIHRCWRIALR